MISILGCTAFVLNVVVFSVWLLGWKLELEMPVSTPISVDRFAKDFKVFGCILQDVQNQDEIKSHLLKGDEGYNYAFINAENIVSVEQVLSVVYKTLLDKSYERMKSKTIHSEVIFNLAPQKNIMECLNKFGVSSDSSNLVVVKVVPSTEEFGAETMDESLGKIVEGTVLPLSDKTILKCLNYSSIKKNYKLADSMVEDPVRLTRMLVGVTQLKGL
ncbi:hypothetical protein BVG19_g578 [[Candida] boidinii]|nr:hypothetical protein BVG19_g578 [[Candida] boidinii]OWB51487.1 hypothetical protein B5S27_g3050 [[Candida] boidinii]OWB65588.1 hypothetical protein B5S30_g914 [[Candida] boidinii]